ncbi:hypothetical protein PG993_008012 [Apiospora rasikravindrae]|uniref:Uncharacterized protein n=1 Tax=Apiospora rasikravindrae TaxID=990691 RepID=A0ABR1SZ57_9PEZI
MGPQYGDQLMNLNVGTAFEQPGDHYQEAGDFDLGQAWEQLPNDGQFNSQGTNISNSSDRSPEEVKPESAQEGTPLHPGIRHDAPIFQISSDDDPTPWWIQ